jgi:hypothetical protein
MNLDSLCSQFDQVYVALPKFERDGTVYGRLPSAPRLNVVHVDADIGAAKKYLACTAVYPRDADTLIVVVDDDYVYTPSFRRMHEDMRREDVARGEDNVNSFAGVCAKYPGLGALGVARREFVAGFTLSLDPTRWGAARTASTTFKGHAGVSFPAHLVGDDLWPFMVENSRDPLLFRNDDVVASAYFAAKGVKRYVHPGRASFVGQPCKPDEWPALLPPVDEVLRAVRRLRTHFRGDRLDPLLLTAADVVAVVLAAALVVYVYRSAKRSAKRSRE